MMKNLLLTIKLVLCILLIRATSPVLAQQGSDARTEATIDSLIEIGLPKSALTEVDKLDGSANRNNNPEKKIKATLYRMLLQSYLEEDAFSEIISGLKINIIKSSYPEKPVLQSLLAQLYWGYYQQNRYKILERSKLDKPSEDFALWDLQTLINETAGLYKLSLADAKREQSTSISILNGVLTGDKETRYLRPTLYDFLVHRAFDFFLGGEAGITRPKQSFSLNDEAFFALSPSFCNLAVKTPDTTSIEYHGIRLLQQATLFRLQSNQPEALADLELRRLNFVYQKSQHQQKDSLYLNSLQQLARQFSKQPINAAILVAIAKYHQQKDSLKAAYSFLKTALDDYPGSWGAKNAGILIRQIKFKEVIIGVEDVNLPQKPLLAQLRFRNISSIDFKLYKLTDKQLKTILKLQDKGNSRLNSNHINPTKALQEYFGQQKSQKDWHLKLPYIGDFKNHITEFKIDPLSTGNYVLIADGKDSADTSDSLASIVQFKITGLAYVSRLKPGNMMELRVMDRNTGLPIEGALVTAGKWKYKNNDLRDSTIARGKTDKNGKFEFSSAENGDNYNQNLAIKLSFNGDEVTDADQYYRQQFSDADEGEKTIFFTDRQIYRPGQTVYFKALQIAGPEEKSRVIAGKEIEVELRDANQKTIASQKYITNEFGSIAGSFILPQSTLNGYFLLVSDAARISVRVEEYKRPTFTVNFDPVKETYRFNDRVTVKGKALAFSGYGLFNAKVSYKIIRSSTPGNYRFYTGIKNGRPTTEVIEIASAVIFTNKNGGFSIPFKAEAGKEYGKPGIVYTYNIEAAVTDASGETKSARSFVTVGNEVLRVQALINDYLPVTDSLIIPLSLSNLNNQLQKGKITARVFSLKPQRLWFKSRLWQKPDIFMMSKEEYQQHFNEYAYGDEEDEKSLQKDTLITERKITITEDQPAYLKLEDFANHPSTKYLIELLAKNERGDTCSARYYTTLITAKPGSLANSSWAVMQNNEVKKGENALFIAGMDQAATMLMEVSEDDKPVLAKWVNLEKGQNKIEVPFKGGNGMHIQFISILANRQYTFSGLIQDKNKVSAIPLKFSVFRNKLEPGQKEQWKIQVGEYKNEQQAVEMVAALYDASLNDISSPQNWMDRIYTNQRRANIVLWDRRSIANSANSSAFFYPAYYTVAERSYERLDMMGYHYFGGYNNAYHQHLQKLQVKRSDAKLLNENYKRSAARFKNGFDVAGKIVDENGYPLPGVSIAVKDVNFKTSTVTDGTFKLRAPKNAVLQITYIGFEKLAVAAEKNKPMLIVLKSAKEGLNEVLIVGYGAQKRSELAGSVSRVQLSGDPLAATVITEDNSTRDFASIEVPAGKVRFMPPAKKEISMRKNFNETAFFYPQLRTNEKGEILIEFTIPETLTRWQFKSFAHRKDLKNGYLEAEIVTQKQLGISANTPRFFREGDTITVSARLANLTGKPIEGKTEIKFFNGITMQPLMLLVDSTLQTQNFKAGSSSTMPVNFKLVAPKNAAAITYRLTASAGEFTDGEENTIPVLPNQMAVTETMPMMVRGGQTKTFTFDKLVNKQAPTMQNKSLTFEYTQNPIWYAVLALPYLMEFPYECSEQTFSRYYANSIASGIIKKMPRIKAVFNSWKSTDSKALLSNLEKNEELKSVLVEETPWVRNAATETEQKNRIALLFDLNKMDNEKRLIIEKLSQLQLPSGAFGWFPGSRYEDRYITQLILAGIGQLMVMGNISDQDEMLTKITTKALEYLDKKLIEDHQEAKKSPQSFNRNYLTVHGWYAHSYFGKEPLSSSLKKALGWYLEKSKTDWKLMDAYQQAMMGLTLMRNQLPKEAGQIISSLKETAQYSDEIGMYWAKNTQGYFWYQSPVETQAVLIELFAESKAEDKAVEEMKTWLLRNKETTNWKTTKATAAACYALLMGTNNNANLPVESASIITLNGTELGQLKTGTSAESATGYIKTSWTNQEIKPELGKIEIQNAGRSISWGAMYWQYLENPDQITSAETQLKLERKYYYQSADDKNIEITTGNKPKVGDVVKVIVYLTADRDYEYVHLKDMRPSGTEPENILSGYRYKDGFYYYEVTKDVATNFFISYLPKGKYVFEYSLRVAQPGNFSTGITQIQSMYAPNFNAHSGGQRIVFEK